MGEREVNFLEDMLFKYIDEFKILFFPEQWANAFMECSKNEILALLLIYRKSSVNMTEVAEYIGAPLNTATGVISRLEKKKLVERTRDLEDKRIVKISLTEQGTCYFEEEKKLIIRYFKALMSKLTAEEEHAIYSVMEKFLSLLKEGIPKEETPTVAKKVRRITIE
ncbi:MAG: MarR family transcriptional regulator [Cellulosilyticum sp.]|nr:MarR family transcriptional regulator [Cellulosilyticum sp.]